MIRPLAPADWEAIRSIYLYGMETKMATFETTPPTEASWFANGVPGTLIGYEEDGILLGFAKVLPTSTRECYKGVGEVTIYLHSQGGGRGIGTQLLQHLVDLSEQQGFWTLKASIFPENKASLRIHEKCGFRVVGRHEKIAQLDGVWRDTLLVERRSQTIV